MQIRPTTLRLPFSGVARVPCSFFLPNYTLQADILSIIGYLFCYKKPITLLFSICNAANGATASVFRFATLQIVLLPPFYLFALLQTDILSETANLNRCKWPVGHPFTHLQRCNGATASLLPICIAAKHNTSSTKGL